MRAPEQPGGPGDVAGGKQMADLRRRVRSAGWVTVDRDQAETEHLEAELRAHAVQQRDVAAAAVTEMEVGADDHEPRAHQVGEHLAHELLGRFARALLVERQHTALVEISRRREQLELLFERREELGGRFGPHHLGRVAVEGHARGLEAARVGQLPHESEHRLVAEVHAVVRADRDHGTGRGTGGFLGRREHAHVGFLVGFDRREHDRRLHRGLPPLVNGNEVARRVDERERPRLCGRTQQHRGGERHAVTNRAHLLRVELDAREVAHRCRRRQHDRVAVGLDHLERMGLSEGERADTQSPERARDARSRRALLRRRRQANG